MRQLYFKGDINYEIIWGHINQSISILIWKLNYKNVYEQKEIDNFVIFHQQKLFAVLVSALINKKLDQNTNLILLDNYLSDYYKDRVILK